MRNQAGDRMGAQRVYEAMISAGVMPDAETLEAVLPGLPSVSSTTYMPLTRGYLTSW